MIPISQALQSGGLQAAYARYEEIKDSPDFFFDADELLNLAYQMMCVKRADLASGVLELNLQVFPDHLDSYLFLAKIQVQQDDRARAQAVLERALAAAPGDAAVAGLLADIRQGRGA
jgi:Tfp pilus assembly protein PilF